MRISVIGGSSPAPKHERQARAVGRAIAERGHELVCGGRTGVMAAACRGAAAADGRTIGILPGTRAAQANRWVDVPIVTGMGNARNVLVVLNGRAAIAIDGSTGTLSEIAHALDLGRPVAGIDTHDVEGVTPVQSAEAAVDHVESAVER